MVRKTDRVLCSKSVQHMATWAYYRFFQHLLFKARQLRGCRVALGDESYTLKAYFSCGLLDCHLGVANVPSELRRLRWVAT